VEKYIHHVSCLEHIQFTFEIKVSRACWSQIEEYRTGKHTAQSHRRTKPTLGDIMWIVPEGLVNMPELYKRYKTHMMNTLDLYDEMIGSGIKIEEARGILPMSTSIRVLWTMDLRNLLHFLHERLNPEAQREIRKLAGMIYSIVIEGVLKELKPALDKNIFFSKVPK
jgi:thymidylate synthase (FAD)